MSHRDTLRALTAARPTSLDPAAPPADPALIMSYPQEETVTRTARRPVGRLVLAAGLPAVALAVTGAFLLNNPSGTGPTLVQPPASAPASNAPAELPTDAGSVLLAAAQRSESTVASDGDYWVLRAEHGEGTRRGQDEMMWLAALPGLPSSGYFRRADGSWAARPMQGHTSANNFLLAGQPRSVQELAALPTDPGQLKRRLLGSYDGNDGEAEGRDVFLFHAGMDLVLDLPVTPQVRGAAYRMLAELPGVTSLGRVTDQRGRIGVAISVTRQGDFAKSQTRLIVDPATGQALASESWTGGRLASWLVRLEARWADGPLPDASTLS
ncbi:CU044_5270 family protein [Catellatospora sichuanensis]|uniref:CU044_5270 family protein n=1 Tax=Catellatospora sichuanensis TaxID=1969805 RepID=UPI001183379F|nr:CU044_5270 family protein [Catellatospora sichuanensis]